MGPPTRVDRGARAPPLRPAVAVGENGEVAGVANDDGAVEWRRCHDFDPFVSAGRQVGDLARFVELRLQPQSPQRVVPHAFQHFAYRAQRVSLGAVALVPAGPHGDDPPGERLELEGHCANVTSGIARWMAPADCSADQTSRGIRAGRGQGREGWLAASMRIV